MKESELVRIAYKKFKANLYFDKTQLPLRDRLVLFENEGIEDKLDELYNALIKGETWEEYEQRILDQICVLLYPKSLQGISDNTAIFSRIVAPKDSASKDIIKTKGGRNSCILVDTIDIKALRDFQMLEYSMQKKDGRFKPSPPGINPDGIIQSKRKNKLKP